MTTSAAVPAPAPTAPRRRPPFLPLPVLALELHRLLRNRRNVIFTMIMPSLLFLLFGSDGGYKTQSAGNGNVTAYIMVSLAVYAAMVATTTTGAAVSLERAAGWSRQLRLSPLRPVSYIVLKAAVAMVAGALAVAVVLLVGYLRGAEMAPPLWLACGVLAWACSMVFAAFGLAMGYLLPGESAMQLLGPLLGLLSFLGGLFVPIDTFGSVFADIARWTPTWGAGELARWPLVGSSDLLMATANIVGWTMLFVALAAWRFRRDTDRV